MNDETLSPLDRAMLRFAEQHFSPATLERLREEIAAGRDETDLLLSLVGQILQPDGVES